MKRYLSDLHLQHVKVLEYDNRPFNSIDEHDDAVIDNINNTVGVDDELYLIGDITRKVNRSMRHLAKIKCKNIFFLQGNHDFSKFCKVYEDLGRTNLGLCHIDKDAKVVLCHYPMEEWFHSRHREPDKYLHIHGHSHGNSENRKGRLDVGITFNPITRPLSLKEIRNIIFIKDNRL